MDYWLGILGEQVDTIVEKAIASEGNSPGAQPAQASGQRWSKGISDPSLHLLWAAKTSRGVMEFRHRHQVDSMLGGISGTEANLVSTSHAQCHHSLMVYTTMVRTRVVLRFLACQCGARAQTTNQKMMPRGQAARSRLWQSTGSAPRQDAH